MMSCGAPLRYVCNTFWSSIVLKYRSKLAQPRTAVNLAQALYGLRGMLVRAKSLLAEL